MRKGVIYKLTFPNGGVYIGQTINLSRRLSDYRRLSCKQSVLLYRTLVKYTYQSMAVEVIEKEIIKEDLNEREIYWIEYFKTMRSKYPNYKGLNICAGGGGTLSKKDSPERVEQKRKWLLLNPIRVKGNYKTSEETKQLLSKIRKGHKWNPGRPWTDKQRIKYAEYCLKTDFSAISKAWGRPQTREEKEKQIEAQKILLLNTETGIYYKGYKEASDSMNINSKTFQKYIESPPKTKNIKLPFIKLSAKKRHSI